ncbi:hypothetical protein LTR85_009038 [Meristemomyces frigidus]|nr:hypothetical protein LTR85_009038 [Meristemomyces frigidus]
MSSSGRPRWTIEQRTSLHLLNTRFVFADPSGKDRIVARIFNHTYSQQLLPDFPQGRTTQNIKEDYRAASGRLQGRSQMWTVITATPRSAEQQQREQALMRDLQARIQTMGLSQEILLANGQNGNNITPANQATSSLTTAPPKLPQGAALAGVSQSSSAQTVGVSGASHAYSSAKGAGQDPTPSLGGNSTYPHNSSASSTMSAANINAGNTDHGGAEAGREASENGGQSVGSGRHWTSPPTYASVHRETADNSVPMQMLHYADCFPEAPQVDAPYVTYIDPSSSIYKLGGKVHRFREPDGSMQDIMICNKNMCGRCREMGTPTLDPASSAADAARVDGLPFIHHYDCAQPRHLQYWWFIPKSNRAYTSEYPRSMWKTAACFRMSNGEEWVKEVMMCDSDWCEEYTRSREEGVLAAGGH